MLRNLILILALVNAVMAGNCDFLKTELGKAFRGGKDPYKGTYQYQNDGIRYLEAKRIVADKCFLLDNLRMVGDNPDLRYHPEWTSVLIDTSKVESVYFMGNDFPVTRKDFTFNAGHFQMYFTFESGGALTPDGETEGLVNSFEAYFDQNELYEPIVKGRNGSYDMVPILSTGNYAFHHVAKYSGSTHLWELDLTKEQMKKLLVRSLREAAQKKKLIARKYNTISNSCVTRQLDLLNAVLSQNNRVLPFHQTFTESDFSILFSGLTKVVHTMLKRHGILKSSTTLKGRSQVLGYLSDNSQQPTQKQVTKSQNQSVNPTNAFAKDYEVKKENYLSSEDDDEDYY